jgi:hypothetical protein
MAYIDLLVVVNTNALHIKDRRVKIDFHFFDNGPNIYMQGSRSMELPMGFNMFFQGVAQAQDGYFGLYIKALQPGAP